jgi:hypothetical protein
MGGGGGRERGDAGLRGEAEATNAETLAEQQRRVRERGAATYDGSPAPHARYCPSDVPYATWGSCHIQPNSGSIATRAPSVVPGGSFAATTLSSSNA